MSEITCREYRPGDEQGILDLYHSVFDLKLSTEWWRWFYERLPEGPAMIAVAEQAGRIVGHYGVQPRPFRVAGQRCVAGLAVGTMIAPEARNVSILVELAKVAYKICGQRKVNLLYAFPNDQAWRVRKALLAWQALPDAVEWEGRLPSPLTDSSRCEMIAKPRARKMSDPGITIEPAAVRLIQGHRDWEWIRWRFFEHPSVDYDLFLLRDDGKVAGYAVAKLYRRDDVQYGHIVDCGFAANAGAAEQVLSDVFRRFAQQKVQRFSCWSPEHSPLGSALAAAGLARQGRASNFGYLALDAGVEEIASQADAWQIYMADSDVY